MNGRHYAQLLWIMLFLLVIDLVLAAAMFALAQRVHVFILPDRPPVARTP